MNQDEKPEETQPNLTQRPNSVKYLLWLAPVYGAVWGAFPIANAYVEYRRPMWAHWFLAPLAITWCWYAATKLAIDRKFVYLRFLLPVLVTLIRTLWLIILILRVPQIASKYAAVLSYSETLLAIAVCITLFWPTTRRWCRKRSIPKPIPVGPEPATQEETNRGRS